jgi:TatD DNase family protein
MIIDSHCHLDYQPLFNNLKNVIERANNNGVKYFLTISTTDQSFKNILNILKNYNNIFGSYGIHPHEAKNYEDLKVEKIIENLSLNKNLIGVGETGLDFYYNHSDKDEQIKLFEEHIKASISSKLPLIIHSRDAEDLTYDILSKYSKKDKLKILMHCFTGTKKFADKLLELDAFFSASGIITFKKSNDLKETFKSIPLNKILIETDSPYLSPEPLRGKSNEPSNVVLTAKYLSKLKEIEFDDLCEGTTNNFFKLFGKLS